MELVVSSHWRLSKQETWRQLFNSNVAGVEQDESILYGDGEGLKQALKAEQEKCDDPIEKVCVVGTSVEKLGSYLANCVCKKTHVFGSKTMIEKLKKRETEKSSMETHILKCEFGNDAFSTKEFDIALDNLLENKKVTECNWFVDNGFLDRALIELKEEKKIISEMAARYFKKVLDNLKVNGRYILVTMGQDYTIREFMRYFKTLKEFNYTCYVINHNHKNDCYGPVLLCIEKKPNGANPSELELKEKQTEKETEKDLHFASVNFDMRCSLTPHIIGSQESMLDLSRIIRQTRAAAFWSQNIIEYNPGKLQYFELQTGTGDSRETHYHITLYDRIVEQTETNHTQGDINNAVANDTSAIKGVRGTITILVPIGDQHNWLYRTESGHQKLADRAACRRIICLFLTDFGPISGDKIHPVETVARIKKEVGPRLVDLSIDKEQPVLLMTQQENFEDEREIVKCTESPFAGKILVFDIVVDVEDDELKNGAANIHAQSAVAPQASGYHRRALIFESNPRMAQTELWYIGDSRNAKFQFAHICHSYHLMILGCIFAHPTVADPQKKINGAVIGLGGGTLSMTMDQLFGDRLTLATVEIDPVISQLATEYFGFGSPRITNHVMDGADFLIQQSAAKTSYQFVVIDINCTKGDIGGSYSGVSCPPLTFFSTQVLAATKEVLGSDGLLIVNCVAYNEAGREAVAKSLKSNFKNLCAIKNSEDLNEIFFAYNGSEKPAYDKLKDLKEHFENSVKTSPEVQALIDLTPMYLGSKAEFVMKHTKW